MGLRCSLMGHDFGEPEVDRDREERGSEVMVTLTEYQRCRRCETTSILSESTEITTIEPPADEHESSSRSETFDTGSDPPADESKDLLERDDGVILDDDEEPPREYGEWPKSDKGDPASQSETGESRSDNVEDEPGPGDSSISGPTVSEVEVSQDSSNQPDNEAEKGGFLRGANEVESPESSVERHGPTEIFCPHCGSGSLGTRHSLRAGDICPECRSGYVAERSI